MYMFFFVIFGLFVSQCVLAQDVQELIVNTKLGQVRGVPASDGDYSMYLGIPYAKVVESNPFGPSIPHPEFDGIFEANDDSHICPQIEEFNQTLAGDLDCLRLNIFVPPTASPTNKLPILVWIFGGRFELGFYGRLLYGPKFLVRHDIILVTINYRVGPYGFMCLDIPEVPGNQGLKDQLLALRWLQDNIEAFGGDPDKITISGNSAGSMSVDLHLLRQNEGPKLIDKAILQSGTSFTLNYEPILDAPLIISDYLEFSTYNMTQALRYLASQDPLTVIQAANALGISGFRPCIEKAFGGVEAFLLNNPIATTLTTTAKDMPIIIGFNNDESSVPYYQLGLNYTVAEVLAGTFNITHRDFAGMEDVVRHFFYGDEDLREDNRQPGIDLSSDISFIYPSIKSLKRFVESEAKNVYLYMFSYNGGRNFVQHRVNVSAGGAWHADELGYLFDISYMDEPTPEDQLIIDRMTTMWANFVKSGDPTPETSELLPYKWEPITKGSPRHFLGIDTAMSAGTSPYNDRMAFWDFFYEINGHLQLALNSVYVVEGRRWFMDKFLSY